LLRDAFAVFMVVVAAQLVRRTLREDGSPISDSPGPGARSDAANEPKQV
jgi:hypothetical protein